MALAAVAWCGNADATTLIRAGIDELVRSNETIVVAQVLDAYSYWNSNGDFILTDVVIAPTETIKGAAGDELTVTLLGGTVGDLTALIVAGAELVPGKSYVLFLDREPLPGVERALTVGHHAQGVFEISARAGGELHAVSQAAGHPLVPDDQGLSQAPGGADGVPLETLLAELRQTAGEEAR